MRIGVFSNGWWDGACRRSGHEPISLPVANHPSGNAYAADLPGRIGNGKRTTELLAQQTVDLLIDNGGTGLGFVPGGQGVANLGLAHELAGKPLVSHFIDPLVTSFQGSDWTAVWQSLQSQSWVKAVWDRGQVTELRRFGIPGVVHLPMAAPDREYDTSPLNTSLSNPIVSFVGGQNTNYFSSNGNIPSSTLLPGTLAQATRGDVPDTPFYDIYHDFFGLGEPPLATDDLQTHINKSIAYFNAKLFHNASLCIRNRDRFVIFLKRRLGESFHLVGNGWDKAYGLNTQPRLGSTDDYFNHFREVAINLNLVNGNAETGLNMRHFEITAAGGFMMCYNQPELGEHFEVGKECVVFDSENDLLEKVQYYLDHPQERADIAKAGQQRTLSHHLYQHRLTTMLDMLQPKPLPVEFAQSDFWDDLRGVVGKADVILDCGANVGQLAQGFREAYPNSEIFSFEPVGKVFDKLSKKCETIKVTPVRAAVGDYDGSATMNLTASPEANSLLGFEAGNPCAQWTKEVGQEEVKICTLDQWCEDNGIAPQRVDIVKLDVQGAELKALHGAKKLLEKTKAVYLEVSFVPIYQGAPLFEEIDRLMTGTGYRRHAIYPSDQPHHWGDALYVKAQEN
jgi:FkbM family methyltransferase